MDARPIGVFDSGVGGLTAVRELTRVLPQEDIIYFGDTGRVPYGTRGEQTIRRYIQQDVRFLLSNNVKMIIVACATASANMTKEIIGSMGKVIYTGVIVPAALKAAEISKTRRIGVIGTSATIRSKAFENVLNSVCSGSRLTANPCPLFVPLVENGYIDFENPVTRLVAEDYLKPFLQDPDLDTLILGCTHFPVLADIIGDIMGKRVSLVDPGREAALYAKHMLQNAGLLNDENHTGSYHYYISDNAEIFSQVASVILREPVKGCVEKIDIEAY